MNLFSEEALAREWRQGRRVGRCIHMMVGADPSEDDILIGVFDSPELSAHIVALHNSAQRDGPGGGDAQTEKSMRPSFRSAPGAALTDGLEDAR